MTSLRLSRSVSVWGSGLALAATGFVLPAAASAATASSGDVVVSSATKAPATASLRTAKVTVSGVRPASVKRSRWTLPVSGTPSLDATKVDLDGRLRFARGKRNVTFTSLRLSLGKKPAISGAVGKRRITILTLSGAPKRDTAAGTISLKGARTSLSSAAVRTLRSKLSTSRIKSGRLGSTAVTVRVKVAVPGPVTPAPAPVPQPTGPTPGVPIDPGGLPPEPQPEPVCWSAPTPVGSTDWIGCGAQTGGNLRSWTNYIGSAGVTLTGGATETPSGTGLDHRFPVVSSVEHAEDGRVTITHAGGIKYFKSYAPAGNLDVQIENLRIVVSADRKTADVVLDATYNSMDAPTLPPEPATDVTAVTIDLAAARNAVPVADGTTYEVAPAKLTAAGRAIWSNYYAEGVAFGAFTLTVTNPAG